MYRNFKSFHMVWIIKEVLKAVQNKGGVSLASSIPRHQKTLEKKEYFRYKQVGSNHCLWSQKFFDSQYYLRYNKCPFHWKQSRQHMSCCSRLLTRYCYNYGDVAFWLNKLQCLSIMSVIQWFSDSVFSVPIVIMAQEVQRYFQTVPDLHFAIHFFRIV